LLVKAVHPLRVINTPWRMCNEYEVTLDIRHLWIVMYFDQVSYREVQRICDGEFEKLIDPVFSSVSHIQQ
jgi:hypothetical protein